MKGTKIRAATALLPGVCALLAVQPSAWSQMCGPGGITPDWGSFLLSDGVTTYTIQDAFDVLRVIYGGLDHDGHFDCNGDVRRSVVKNWAGLTQTANCPSPTNPVGCSADGLRHAWRRGDLDPVTVGFVSMVGFGTRAIGNNPFTGGPLLKQQNPFCNSMDANQPTPAFPVCGAGVSCPQNFACDQPSSSPMAGHCVWTNNAATPGPCSATVACPAGFGCDATGHCSVSDGGMSDFSDNDPIRVRCLTPIAPPVAQIQPGTGFEEVCTPDPNNLQTLGGGSLGLVLPMLLPDNPAVTAADDYPTVDCDNNTCDLVAPAQFTRIPPGHLCPDGQPVVLNRCWMPFHVDATAPDGHNFNCRSDKRTDHCFAIGSGPGAEGRAYNKVMMKVDPVRGWANATDSHGRLMTGSFFRLRAGLNSRTPVPNGGTNVDPTPCNTATSYASQLACLTAADTCSMGM
jgi:hypothetical protein